MKGGHNQFFFCAINGQFPQQTSIGVGSHLFLRQLCTREKREPILEIARMRTTLIALEKDHVYKKQELVRSHPANKIFKSFTKKLSKLNSLFRINNLKPIGGKADLLILVSKEKALPGIITIFKGEGITRYHYYCKRCA
ncbi:hypothetical protein PVK06_026645 [Gossypium arboreum]|uniref:Uncharacterized protein n=1 Tax=Gossypium arboreum TaxID=29729 RepID=A0ABR0P1P3_GOSAR|nr:hypothetical protein PVK06_026645 [Gossypium arboreum]